MASSRPMTGEEKLEFVEANLLLDDAPIRLDWWQRSYIYHSPQFLIANKSRRIGWSFITALKGLIEANDINNGRYTKQFVSYSKEDAKDKISFAREFYYSLPKEYRKKIVSETKTSMEFLDRGGKTISRLISLPCKPPRGRGGVISLDEFAFHKDDHSIYIGALPVITRGGSIEIGSTPFGNKGKFYEILTDKKRYPKFERFNLYWYFSPALCKDVYAAIAEAPILTTQQLVEKYGTEILKDIFQSMPIDDFEQEYCCSFRDELAAFIPLEKIQGCTPVGDDEIIPFKTIDEFILAYRPAEHGLLYAGYDVGRTNNAAELAILGYFPEKRKKILWVCISYRKVDFDTQYDNLRKTINKLPVYRLALDATGLGMNLGENLQKKSPDWWSLFSLPILLNQLYRRLCIWLLTGKSCFCRQTATCRFRFTVSARRSRLPNMPALMWTVMPSITRINIGLSPLPSTL